MPGYQRHNNPHVGWRPDRQDGSAAGPYAHVSHNSGPGEENYEIGLGLLNGENGGLASANAQLGVWGDEASENSGSTQRVGARANAQLAKGATNNNDNFWNFDGGAINADAEMSIGADGFTVGAGANLVHGAVQMGDISAEDQNDLQVRGGLGLGAGAGVRGHWGDADGDGIRELGFGFDYGVGSFDVKSETLGQAWNWITGGDTNGEHDDDSSFWSW